MSLPNLPELAKKEQQQVVTNTTEDFIKAKRRKIEEELDRRISESKKGSIERTNIITSDILMKAPRNFFDKFIFIVENITTEIQRNIAETRKSYLFTELKENPTDEKLKREVLNLVNAEWMKYTFKEDPEFVSFNKNEQAIIFNMVVNEIVGMGPLEPLFQDFNIREIMCNGPFDVQVEIDGTVHRVPACKFKNRQHLENLIAKFYNSVNKDLTRGHPMEKARLKDNSRIFAIHNASAPNGPNFNIRRHTESWTHPKQILDWEMMSPEMMEWTGNMINAGLSTLVVGATSTGKALTLDTKIPTPNGYIRIGDIQIGDIVYDKDYNEVKVTHIFDQDPRDVYRVEFENGFSQECDLEHNWLVSSRASRIPYTNEANNKAREVFSNIDKSIINDIKNKIEDTPSSMMVTTTNIINSYKDIEQVVDRFFRAKYYSISRIMDKNTKIKYYRIKDFYSFVLNNYEKYSVKEYSVKTTEEIANNLSETYAIPLVKQQSQTIQKETQLSVHPYILGIILIAGRQNSINLSIYDNINYIQNTISELDLEDKLKLISQSKDDDIYNVIIDNDTFLDRMNNYSSIFTNDVNEFIQKLSYSDAYWMLRGIIDAQKPKVTSTGTFKFHYIVNLDNEDIPQRAKVIKLLGYKLGCYVGDRLLVIDGINEITINGRDLKLSSEEIIPARQSSYEHSNINKIKDIIKTNKIEPMRCITVDSPSHTYLAGEGHIVTHNTTLISALSSFYPDNQRIVTIEKNIELKLPPHKLTAAQMEEIPAKAGSLDSGLSLRDLTYAATQMRPDIIIVGEITGDEAYDFLTALNSGHTGITSTHSSSAAESVNRIVQLASTSNIITGKSLYDLIATAFDIIIMINRFDDGTRKITEIAEVGLEAITNENGKYYLPTNTIWKFIPDPIDPEAKEIQKTTGKWEKQGELSNKRQARHNMQLRRNLDLMELFEIATPSEEFMYEYGEEDND